MKLKWASRIVALSLGALFCSGVPLQVTAQDQPQEESHYPSVWSTLREGKLSVNVRYRFEGFERDGPPFTATSYASTIRLSVGYETPSFHGFTVFAQGEGVTVLGPADYSVPLRPPQNHPNLPAILEPKSLEMNQGYVKWTHSVASKKLTLIGGRQELTLNDGRFLNISNWRQVHGTFDAVRFDTDLPLNFSFTYAFINRFYREDGYDATDGEQPMHSHLWNLAWSNPDKIKIALYGLLLDFHAPAQFSTSSQSYGVRASGPFQFNKDWSLIYTAEYAKQKNFGSNPNRVDANYYLGELGPGWRGLGVKAGCAFLSGRSATDLLTTPLAPPFNGWTDLFITNPVKGNVSGLEARYLSASGPVRFLGGTLATVIFYDYHSDNLHIHYGRELDSAMSYKFKRFHNRWEIGWRFGRYWADQLFTNALRTSVYTSFTM
jgi:hypothetical protein